MKAARKITGLILSAGCFSQMDMFEPLGELGGKTVVELAVESLRRGGVSDIRVVMDCQAKGLAALERLNVETIISKPPQDIGEAGALSAALAGIKSAAAESEACFLLPLSAPLIRRSSFKTMLKEYYNGAAIVEPVFNRQKGWPLLIGNKCFKDILKANPAKGLKGILREAAFIKEVELTDKGILFDINTLGIAEIYRRREIPTDEECLAMLHKYQSNPKVWKHGYAVGRLGRRIAVMLNKAGGNLDVDLTFSGGFVHDLAKGKFDHAKRGGRILAFLGFPRVARIVDLHMDLKFQTGQNIDEAAIIYLADKLVQEDKLVTLGERFAPAFEIFADNPEVIRLALERMHTAEVIKDEIINIAGRENFAGMLLKYEEESQFGVHILNI